MSKEQIGSILMEMCFSDEPPMPNASLKDDLGIDSLRLAELMVALEEAFSITLSESDLDPAELDTVADVERMISKYA